MVDALQVIQSIADDASAKIDRLVRHLTLSAVAFCLAVITALAGAGFLIAALFFALNAAYTLPVALSVTGFVCLVPVGVFCVYLSLNGRNSRNQAPVSRRAPSQSVALSAAETSDATQMGDALVAQQLVHCLNDAVSKYPMRSIAAATLAGWAMSQSGLIDDLEV